MTLREALEKADCYDSDNGYYDYEILFYVGNFQLYMSIEPGQSLSFFLQDTRNSDDVSNLGEYHSYSGEWDAQKTWVPFLPILKRDLIGATFGWID